MGLDDDFEPARILARSNSRDLAVIDRREKAAFGGAALEPGAAPARDRHMRDVAVDINTGHQPAAKTETAGGGIVMDLVLGIVRGVVGGDLIGGERGARYIVVGPGG